MKCNNCGAEVPEGKTTCPNCAADPLAPKKEKQLGKYRESIKAFRRLCIFEWLTYLLTEVAYVLAYIYSWSSENVDLYFPGKRNIFSSSALPLIFMIIVFAGWTAAMAYVYDEMKYYEKSFHEIVGVKIRLAVMLFVALVGLCAFGLLFIFLCGLLFIQIVVGLAVSYHHTFQALAAYIKELSADMAWQLDQLSAIFPVLIAIIGPTAFFLMIPLVVSLPKEGGEVVLLLIGTIVQVLFLIVLPMFMLRCYRLCRSTRVSRKS